MDRFNDYDWPGNIRKLFNELQRFIATGTPLQEFCAPLPLKPLNMLLIVSIYIALLGPEKSDYCHLLRPKSTNIFYNI
jgi:DNA-binding NtrC family response regulator